MYIGDPCKGRIKDDPKLSYRSIFYDVQYFMQLSPGIQLTVPEWHRAVAVRIDTSHCVGVVVNELCSDMFWIVLHNQQLSSVEAFDIHIHVQHELRVQSRHGAWLSSKMRGKRLSWRQNLNVRNESVKMDFQDEIAARVSSLSSMQCGIIQEQ